MAEPISASQLIDDLTAVIRDAESLLRATAAQTGDKSRGDPRARRGVGAAAKERLAGIEDEALKHARVLAGEADEYVRGNPWQAVGIAAGVGTLLGMLLTRR